MKITRVETIVLNLPMLIDGATPMLGGRARTSIDMLLVRVDTDGGVTGWGEAFGHRIFPATRAAIDTLLGPMCVGRDPSQIAALNDEIQRLLHGIGRSGPAIYALSGIDIALWDIAGKVAGVPLYRLLGGSPRADLPAYASLLRYGTAEAVAHYTEQARARDRRRRELRDNLGVSSRLRSGGGHVCAAERDQDRRRDRDASGHDPRRDVRRPGRSALGVLRAGAPRVDPLHRRDAGRVLGR